MTRPTPGMGRGLDAILSVSAEAAAAPEEELRELPLELISPARRQPRERFDEQALQALADSVRERGVLQPVLARPKAGGTYELVAGERRWRAARLAGLDVVPALVRALRARRLRHYQRSLALLEERLAESPLVTALRDELASLQRERATFALSPVHDRP